MQTKEDIEQFISTLNIEIEKILNKNISTEPPYSPNYMQFYDDIGTLLKPVFVYCDREFHEGNVREMALFNQTQQIIAAKKFEAKKQLEKYKNDPKKSLPIFQKFKMLFGYFSNANPGSKNTLVKLADLEYEFSQETDLDIRIKLLEEIVLIIGESSMGDYLQAKDLFDQNNFDEALIFCNEGIKKFPGNTIIRDLKSKVLRRMDEENLIEGIEIDPYDKNLLFEHNIVSGLKNLREKIDSKDISAEDFFVTANAYIQEKIQGFDLTKYEQIANVNLNGNTINNEVLHFLATAEYLLEKHPLLLDHAPIAVEFCKALEEALKKAIFSVFNAQYGSIVGSVTNPTRRENNLVKYCAGTREFTLGEMAFVFQIMNLNNNYGNELGLRKFKEFITNRLNTNTFNVLKHLLSKHNVDNYRNGAAHTSTFDKTKAVATKNWCYSIIELL